MHYRRLGQSGLKISAISLGGWINFGADKLAEEKARSIVDAAYEQGINFFDLADVYANGQAELQMGKLLARYPRHTLVISSKAFWPMSKDVNDRGLSRKHLLESIDKSLGRLGLDYLDLYFCHRADPETPLRETVMAMHTLIEQGKVLYWGTSEWPAAQIVAAYDLCERYGWHPPQAEQPQYSMLYRQPVEDQILPVTEPRGMGLVTWSPLAMGMLTGKYDDGIPADSRFARETWVKDRFLNEANAAKVRQLRPLAAELGITRAQLALAWSLRQPGVSSVITGATQPEQVLDNVQAADVQLNPDVLAQIEEILAGNLS
ncbi:MAG: aldo/keto reductase family protein [Caldilineales bacterium]|nr:aldo/keto reductase family protein [Caldilineales bacterium]